MIIKKNYIVIVIFKYLKKKNTQIQFFKNIFDKLKQFLSFSKVSYISNIIAYNFTHSYVVLIYHKVHPNSVVRPIGQRG